MGEQVVVPVGIGGSAALGRKHGVAAVQLLVHHRVQARLAGLGTYRVQQQQRCASELTAHVPAVAPELLDDLVVPVAHDFSSPVYRLSIAYSGNQAGVTT